MILELLDKIANAILDRVVGPMPEPPAPKPEKEPAPELDPRQTAAEMRTLAALLHQEADRLDPITWPVQLPTLPDRWNRILDALGESGGIVKRSDLAAKAKKPRDPEDLEMEKSKELLKKLEGLLPPVDSSPPCCGEDCDKEFVCDTPKCPGCCAEKIDQETIKEFKDLGIFNKPNELGEVARKMEELGLSECASDGAKRLLAVSRNIERILKKD